MNFSLDIAQYCTPSLIPLVTVYPTSYFSGLVGDDTCLRSSPFAVGSKCSVAKIRYFNIRPELALTIILYFWLYWYSLPLLVSESSVRLCPDVGIFSVLKPIVCYVHMQKKENLLPPVAIISSLYKYMLINVINNGNLRCLYPSVGVF